MTEVDIEEVTRQIQDAVEKYILGRVSPKDIEDMEVTVSYEDGDLSIEVYLDAPGSEDIVEDAVREGFLLADRLFTRIN